MKAKTGSVIIFGINDFAQIAYEYFTYDSEYDVVAFTVDSSFVPEVPLLCGLPIISFEDIQDTFPPGEYEMYVAIVYGNLNRNRAAITLRAKEKGYRLASYISSCAFVWRNAVIGEHAFIFEDNTVQPFVTIGNNCVLWSGNHIGHHSRIGDNVFISSHVVVSGHCDIGDNCFLGVNSTLANGTLTGKESWVAHSSNMSGKIPPGSLIRSQKSTVTSLNEEALAQALARIRR